VRRSVSIAAAGLLLPAAVLAASAAPPPAPVRSTTTSPAPVAEPAAQLVRDAAFGTPYTSLVGYDRVGDTLVVQRDGKHGTAEVAGLDARTGSARWRQPLNRGDTLATVLWSQRDLSAGVVFVNTLRRGTGELVALGTTGGDVRWRMPLTDRTLATAAGAVLLVAEPGQDILSALDSATGKERWRAALPTGCEVVSTAADGTTVALQLRCDNRTELQLRAAKDGALRSQTTLEIAVDAPADGVGLLVRDGTTVVRGARSFQVFAADGRRLVDRPDEGCFEYCDVALDGDTVLLAHSGSITDPADGALEAIALADGRIRWRSNLTVDALVRTAGHLYAVGPAPQPVPFLTIAAVAADGAAPALATDVPALNRPQVDPVALLLALDGTRRRPPETVPALLISHPAGDGDLLLEWHRVRPRTGRRAGGYLGDSTAPGWPDACAALTPADLRTLLGRTPAAATDLSAAGGPPHSRCRYTAGAGSFTVETLWSGVDEADVVARWQRVAAGGRPVRVGGEDDAVQLTTSAAALDGGPVRILLRVGRVVMAVTGTTATARRGAAMVADNMNTVVARG